MQPTSVRSTSRRGPGRALEVALALYGAVVFVALWAGIVVGLATGGALFVDAWAWLTGLDTPAAVVAWILFLPIAVWLWAWNSFDAALVRSLVAVGLVAWTLLMASGLVRTLRRSRAR